MAEDGTLALRIASIFIIGIVSVLGCASAFALRKWHGDSLQSPIFRVFKSIAAGVVVGVGLIHVLPDAANALSQFSEFPIVYTVAAYSVIFTVALEHLLLHKALDLAKKADATRAGHGHDRMGAGASAGGVREQDAVELEELRPAQGECGSPVHRHGVAGATGDMCADVMEKVLAGTHSGKAVLTAHMLELGIVLHSVIIGVGLGSLTDSYNAVQALLIALCVHQAFEGLSLGACIVNAKVPKWRAVGMAALFSITTPIGVVLGIIATLTTDPEGPAATWVQGIFNSIGAGILLYTGLVTLVAAEFDDHTLHSQPGLKAAMFGSVVLGVTLMAILAHWA